jgi:hypothetical protein
MQTIMVKIEKIIFTYIPKNTRCRSDEARNEFRRAKEKVEFINIIKEKVDMANPLSIDIKTDWAIEMPNMSVCQSCKETIYNPQYVLNVYVCGDKLDLNCPKVICQNCYNSIND